MIQSTKSTTKLTTKKKSPSNFVANLVASFAGADKQMVVNHDNLSACQHMLSFKREFATQCVPN